LDDGREGQKGCHLRPCPPFQGDSIRQLFFEPTLQRLFAQTFKEVADVIPKAVKESEASPLRQPLYQNGKERHFLPPPHFALNGSDWRLANSDWSNDKSGTSRPLPCRFWRVRDAPFHNRKKLFR
jgi:hypothetical protein